MIIAVEGNVHVGKTTFCTNFVAQNPEYTIVPECKFDATLQPYDIQINYINQELSKKQTYTQDNLIMDRSIISTFIYTTFTDTLSASQKADIIDKIKNHINKQEFILPQKICFLVTDGDIVEKRQDVLGKQKGTQDVLGTNTYNDYYNNFLLKHNPVFVRQDRANKIYEIDASIVLDTIKRWEI